MNIEIINIGDELLIGQVVNTNASWMGEQLSLSGFRCRQFTIIGDTREQILEALQRAGESNDVVLISGGIGPTKDDITKTTLCEFFGTRLVFNEEAYKDVEVIFAKRGYPVTELNRQQAFLPESCVSIPNPFGTARGMWFEIGNSEIAREDSKNLAASNEIGQPRAKDGCEAALDLRPQAGIGHPLIYVSMPGVPFEMKAMMLDHVIPRLKEKFHPQSIYHKTILTQGIGESFLAAMIEDWENKLPANVKLAYLPQPGMVRLRLTGTGKDDATIRAVVESEAEKLSALIPDYIFGENDDKIEEIVGRLLKIQNQTLVTAESCTGGYIAHLVTSIPGSSAWFKGSVVAYDNSIKTDMLGVSRKTLEQHGAVSREVVTEMAIGAQSRLEADWAIAVSGIAGPDGGTGEKPVGTVWIAIAGPEGPTSHHYLFGDSRERNIRRAALQALNLLRKQLLSQI